MSDKSDDILQLTDIPAPDDNARKTALNLASTEFAAYQNEKSEKKSQGIHFLSRLMSMNNSQNRRSNMKTRKFIYGGMATAMVVVLVGGAALYKTGINTKGVISETASVQYVQLRPLSLSRGAGSSSITTSSAPATLKLQEEDPLELWRRQAPTDQGLAKMAAPQALSDMATNSVTGGAAAGMVAQESQIAPYPYPLPVPIDVMPPQRADNDKFKEHDISPVKQVAQEPVSTFSVDVDTASYSFVRRQLEHGYLPNPDAVRIEEMINYFPYHYQGPDDKETPFKANVEVVDSPWKPGNKLIHIGIKGYDIDKDVHTRPRANLVFLIDVSGSMSDADKLPLLKNSFRLLLNTLDPEDTVSIVTYAGAAGVVLPPTKVKEKEKIAMAMFTLSPGGSTAGAAGIQGAYALAEQNFDKEAVNRIILATDGDFNVGMSSDEELKKLIEEKRKSGIFLSVLGFGQGNLNDSLMQTLAQNGNGVAAHIDSLSEAQKVLVDEATSSLFPIAKDVKIQVEFNPNIVSEYRLIGYETRALNREDFNNDKVDAGDIGAGHTVTAIYEITPKGSDSALYGDSRYEKVEKTTAQTDFGNEYAFLKMRYKLPDEDTSHLITTPITTDNQIGTLEPVQCGPTEECVSSASNDVRFSIAVAGFGQLLKNDKYLDADFGYENVLTLAQDGKGDDPYGYRSEFINLVRLAETLDQNQ
ncbi:MAG: VWA domain-containing protein [Rhodospirillales bacterium]|nr:VWA domain-containing protein [Rhodospirillales bacterium]